MNRILKSVALANVVAIAGYFGLSHLPGLYRIGTQFPVPSGYFLNTLPEESSQLAGRCALIRFGDRFCPDCRRDTLMLAQLASASRAHGCEYLELAPDSESAQLRAPLGAQQLGYVDLQFGLALNPYVTPTTIILDRGWRMRWYWPGSLDRTSIRGALAALGSVGR